MELIFSPNTFTSKYPIKVTNDRIVMNYHQQPAIDICINVQDDISLFQIGKENLSEFTRFVFDMYAYHYAKKHQWSPPASELHDMVTADQLHFENSFYLAYKDSQGNFIGTLKATLRDQSIVFPIEDEFGININEVICDKSLIPTDIWHFGRLAIDSKILRNQNSVFNSRDVFSRLFNYAFTLISRNPGSMMIAESDTLIYDLFHEMGINMQIIGPQKNYM